MDLAPTILNSAYFTGGSIELAEWRWPPIISFTRAESALMVEMSLPPLAADASASFPDIAPGQHCFMGRLFVRYPGVQISGRSDGGQIRVLRCTFAPEEACDILALCSEPGLEFLQSLLNLRSDTLRHLMVLAHRELINPLDCSLGALQAYHRLIRIEMLRLFAAQIERENSSRLAPWQYRHIRERLAGSNDRPTVSELARLCGISARHLQRQFTSLTGESVASYIENFRMKQAKDLLASPDMPIKAIAVACGFLHANSFARAFRRATGQSPARFRQQISQDHQPPRP